MKWRSLEPVWGIRPDMEEHFMRKHRSWPVWSMVIAMLAAASMACSLSRTSDTATEDIDSHPLVALIAPVNSSVFAEGAVVRLYAIAQDSLSGVARIEFRIDDVPVGEVTSPQPEGQTSLEGTVEWTAAGRTGHLITVEGFRANGSSLGLSDAAIKVVARPAEQA
ncbi:MAG TPA: Ig-like domain-containing protein, partial [Aggregatilinea sp.]|uniref:Ig-like domain-containing protein n=1 Tax=Aggregatilinea sp. TaxID=2806333 RepID=UPI002C24BF9A